MSVSAAFMKKGRKTAEGRAAEEKAESPIMEKEEGPEYGDAPHGKKPCAKCAKKGKKKGNCDCDGKKMDAALTPSEYLDACDLGIQGRSRDYIRARLDATAGKGVKCGNGYIGRGKKCRSGAGALASSTPNTGTGNKLQARTGKALNIAAGVGGVATRVQSLRHLFKGNLGKARAYGYAGNALGVLQGQGRIMEGRATGNEELINKGRFQKGYSLAFGAARAVLNGDLKRVGKAAVTGYRRAQAKKPKMRNMSEEEYSAAARAAGNPEGPSSSWSPGKVGARNRRRGSVKTTSRPATVGMLRGN